MPVTVPVNIELQIADAVRRSADTADKIANELKQIDRQAAKTSKAVNAISFIEITRAAIDFGRALKNVFDKAIQEAVEADDAINSLANSLKLAGDFSQQNVLAFQSLADELASISRFSNDVILSQVRVGKQFGLTNREVEKLLRASVEYASFSGDDLTTVVRQLGQTFDGTAGRLNEVVPALRGLSKESLRSGAAVDLFLRLFSGSSQRNLETFSGSVAQFGKQFDDVFEAIGNAVVKNEGIILLIAEIGNVLSEVASVFNDTDGTIKAFVTTVIKTLVDALGVLAQALRFPLAIFTAFKVLVDVVAAVLKTLIGPLVKLTQLDFRGALESLNLVKNLEGFAKETNASYKSASDFLENISAKSGEISVKLEGVIDKQLGVSRAIGDQRKKLDGQLPSIRRLRETEEERLKRIEEQNRLLKEQQELQRKLLEQRRQSLENATRNPFAEITSAGGNIIDRIAESFADAGARLVGVLSAAGRGRAGATQLIGQGIEAATGIPGVSQLVEILAQGPEAVRQLVQEFADAIPDVILAIAESIPVILETIAEKLPDIITKLVENAPRIITALVRAIPAFAGAIFRVIGDAAVQFSREVLGGAFKFVGEILKGAFSFIQEIINGIGDAFNRLIDNINPLKGLGIGGGGDNPAGGAAVGAGIGFAVGGPVGALIGGIAGSLFGKQGSNAGAGFSNSGGRQSGSAQPVNISLRVGSRELAQVMTDIKRQGFAT